MIELHDTGLVTSDPVIASMFLGKKIRALDGEWRLMTIDEDGDFWIGKFGDDEPETCVTRITIPYPLVREAYQPVEGEGFVFDHPDEPLYTPLNVEIDIPGHPYAAYHKRVLNIVTSRAELRELVAKCQEAGK